MVRRVPAVNLKGRQNLNLLNKDTSATLKIIIDWMLMIDLQKVTNFSLVSRNLYTHDCVYCPHYLDKHASIIFIHRMTYNITIILSCQVDPYCINLYFEYCRSSN